MAKVRILLEAGQSNAYPLGDIQSWEDLYSHLAIRSPNTTTTSSFAQGSYKDTFRLTGTFPGGWTADALGAEEIGQFQTANCAGVAVQMVKSAVFYNPTPIYLDYDAHTSDYPGRFRLSGSSQFPHRITTDMMMQGSGTAATCSTLISGALTTSGDHGFSVDDYIVFGTDDADGLDGVVYGDRSYKVATVPTTTTLTFEEWPSGDTVSGTATVANVLVAKVLPMTITRHRTGTEHTAVPASIISRSDGEPFTLNVEPPLDPAPGAGEVFDHELVLQAAATTTGALVLNRRYGGYRDGGSDEDAVTWLPVTVGYEDQGADIPSPYRLTLRSSQIKPGMQLQGLVSTGTADAHSGANSDFLQISANSHGVAVVGDDGPHGIQEGERLQFTTDGTLPSGLSTSTDYYAFQVVKEFDNADIGESGGAGYITIGASSDADNRVYADNEKVRLEGNLPASLDDQTTYYTAPAVISSNEVIGLRTTSGGSQIAFGAAATGKFTVRRLESLQVTSTPGSTDPVEFDPATGGATGTHTITRVVRPAALTSSMYVTRKATADEIKTYVIGTTIVAVAGDKLDTQGVAHGLTQDEPVRVSGADLPTGLTTGTTYYVQQDTFDTFSLVESPLIECTVLTPLPGFITGLRALPFSVGDTVTMSSDPDYVPGGFTPGSTYYVVQIDDYSGLKGVQLSSTSGGTEINVTSQPPAGYAHLNGKTVSITAGSGSGVATFERLDSHCSFYVSDELGGEELVYAEGDVVRNEKVTTTKRLPQFSGYFNGLQLRCSSGTAANIGKTVMLKHCERDTSGDVDVSKLHHDGTWSSAPQAGDKFVVEVPPVDGKAVPFDEFCKILPWSPFEGRSSGQATPYQVTFGSNNTVKTPAALEEFYRDAAVQFFSTGVLPNGLTPGKTYYLKRYGSKGSDPLGNIDGVLTQGSFTYSATYQGSEISYDSTKPGTGEHYMVCVDADGRDNPFPPGFNYPGQFSRPQVYQHDRGPRRDPGVKVTSGLTAAMRMAMHYGEPVLHLNCALAATSIAHREVAPDDDIGEDFAWFDNKRQISWAKGEPDGCFARLQAVLRGVKRALDEQGDTGEVELITWVQGESDATRSDMSTDYDRNLRQLKADMRQAIVDAGLYSGKAEHIPFVQPTIRTENSTPAGDIKFWQYAKAVNTAIEAVALDDPYSRSVDGTDITSLYESDNDFADYVHYSGSGMDTLGRRMFDAWVALQRRSSYTEVEICNLALTNLGDRGGITSFRPSDGSRQADLCAQFYDLALNVVLQRHPWDFSIRRVSPTKIDVDRTEWTCSFELPDDFVGVLAVLPEKPADDVSWMGRKVPVEFAIELDGNRQRRLYSNYDNVVLRYHAKVTDPSFYSEMFVQALSWKLATLLAAPLIKGEAGVAAAQRAQQMFEFMLQQAAGYDAVKTRERRLEDTTMAEWDRSRGESYDYNEWENYR